MEKAVIFVPSTDDERSAACCAVYIMQAGYLFDGIVCGNWEDVREMMRDGRTDVVVVADQDHLPPDRTPRIEVIACEPGAVAADTTAPPRRRRPRPTH
jgi:hypothetical protein